MTALKGLQEALDLDAGNKILASTGPYYAPGAPSGADDAPA